MILKRGNTIKIFNTCRVHFEKFEKSHKTKFFVGDINKELLNPYYAEGEEISKRKLSNFILEGLEEILERIKESSNIILHPNHISNMILFRTGYGYNFEIDYNQCLIYLPQTNQIFYGSKNGIDKNIFISQAYVLVIEVPLAGIEPATHGLEVHRSVH